jgi:hypothetical protein
MPAMLLGYCKLRLFFAFLLASLSLGAIVESVGDLPGYEYDFIIVGGAYSPLSIVLSSRQCDLY